MGEIYDKEEIEKEMRGVQQNRGRKGGNNEWGGAFEGLVLKTDGMKLIQQHNYVILGVPFVKFDK